MIHDPNALGFLHDFSVHPLACGDLWSSTSIGNILVKQGHFFIKPRRQWLQRSAQQNDIISFIMDLSLVPKHLP